jgi:hypothetical protein
MSNVSHERQPPLAPSGASLVYQPTANECAVAVLQLLHAKMAETGRAVTRARLSEITLRRLWVRSRITDDLLREIQEHLVQAGWSLFWAGTSYAIISIAAVEGWGRISSKLLSPAADVGKQPEPRKPGAQPPDAIEDDVLDEFAREN